MNSDATMIVYHKVHCYSQHKLPSESETDAIHLSSVIVTRFCERNKYFACWVQPAASTMDKKFVWWISYPGSSFSFVTAIGYWCFNFRAFSSNLGSLLKMTCVLIQPAWGSLLWNCLNPKSPPPLPLAALLHITQRPLWDEIRDNLCR
jgi:hypothetical protein